MKYARIRDRDVSNAINALCGDVRRRNNDARLREDSNEVLARAQQGDVDAIERAMFSVFWWVLKRALHKTKGNYHDTLDKVQDGCVSLLHAIRTWEGTHGVVWFTHANIRVRQGMGRPRRAKQTFFEKDQYSMSAIGRSKKGDPFETLLTQPEDSIEREEVLDAIRQLPFNQQRVVERALAGIGPTEMAEEFGLSKQAAQQMQAKAVKTLRRILGEDNADH